VEASEDMSASSGWYQVRCFLCSFSRSLWTG